MFNLYFQTSEAIHIFLEGNNNRNSFLFFKVNIHRVWTYYNCFQLFPFGVIWKWWPWDADQYSAFLEHRHHSMPVSLTRLGRGAERHRVQGHMCPGTSCAACSVLACLTHQWAGAPWVRLWSRGQAGNSDVHLGFHTGPTGRVGLIFHSSCKQQWNDSWEHSWIRTIEGWGFLLSESNIEREQGKFPGTLLLDKATSSWV